VTTRAIGTISLRQEPQALAVEQPGTVDERITGSTTRFADPLRNCLEARECGRAT